MIAGGDAVDAGIVQLGTDLGGDAEARGRVLAVDDHEIEPEFLAQTRHVPGHGLTAGPSDDVAAEQDLHASDKGASPLVGQQPIEPLIARTVRNFRDQLSVEADPDGSDVLPGAQPLEGAVVEATAVA